MLNFQLNWALWYLNIQVLFPATRKDNFWSLCIEFDLTFLWPHLLKYYVQMLKIIFVRLYQNLELITKPQPLPVINLLSTSTPFHMCVSTNSPLMTMQVLPKVIDIFSSPCSFSGVLPTRVVNIQPIQDNLGHKPQSIVSRPLNLMEFAWLDFKISWDWWLLFSFHFLPFWTDMPIISPCLYHRCVLGANNLLL